MENPINAGRWTGSYRVATDSECNFEVFGMIAINKDLLDLPVGVGQILLRNEKGDFPPRDEFAILCSHDQ